MKIWSKNQIKNGLRYFLSSTAICLISCIASYPANAVDTASMIRAGIDVLAQVLGGKPQPTPATNKPTKGAGPPPLGAGVYSQNLVPFQTQLDPRVLAGIIPPVPANVPSVRSILPLSQPPPVRYPPATPPALQLPQLPPLQQQQLLQCLSQLPSQQQQQLLQQLAPLSRQQLLTWIQQLPPPQQSYR